MSTETDVTSEVARVLGEHYPDVTSYDAGDLHGCMGCGWEVPRPRSNDTDDWEAYWAHQAAMLAEAGLLRDHATIDALNERCRILVDEGDHLRARIAAQEPAGGTRGGFGDSRASGGLGERLRALVPAIYADDGYFGVTALEIREFADEADRMERDREGLRLRAELAESGLAMAARQKRAEREGS